MPDAHEHDWRPDGESWMRTVSACNCDFSENIYVFEHESYCSRERERVRRYTCHCGDSKVVILND